MDTMIIFWLLVLALAIWAAGVLAFIYHGVSYRYPRDIAPVMIVVFVLVAFPLLILLVGYMSDLIAEVF